jgi:integrase
MSNQNEHTEKYLRPLFDEYLQECKFSSRLRPATTRGYDAVFSLFLHVMPEVRTVRFLTAEMMVEFFKRLQVRSRIVGKSTFKTGVKDSTVKTYWSKLNSFFEWLARKNCLPQNPLAKIKRPPEPKYEDSRALKDPEVDKIISAIMTRAKSPLALRRDMVIISLLLYCGLRRGELISLQVKDLDMVKGAITIRGETSKSKKSRTLPMHPTLILHLKDYMTERVRHNYKTEHLLVSTNHDNAGLTRNGLRHWEKRLNKLSGVSFHLHRFRHSFATNLARKDVGIVKIQKLLGHSSLGMTERYVRSMAPEELRDEISRL